MLVRSFAEHQHAWRSSFILPFYLLATVFCDIVRTRTFVDTEFLNRGGGAFLKAFAASLGARFLSLLAENIERGFIFKQMGITVSYPCIYKRHLADSRPAAVHRNDGVLLLAPFLRV